MLSLTGEEDLVLRLMTREPWRANGHGLTTRESQIQQMLVGTPIPVPRSRALDADGHECGYPAHRPPLIEHYIRPLEALQVTSSRNLGL